mgnify:CR=1 FL=1
MITNNPYIFVECFSGGFKEHHWIKSLESVSEYLFSEWKNSYLNWLIVCPVKYTFVSLFVANILSALVNLILSYLLRICLASVRIGNPIFKTNA